MKKEKPLTLFEKFYLFIISIIAIIGMYLLGKIVAGILGMDVSMDIGGS